MKNFRSERAFFSAMRVPEFSGTYRRKSPLQQKEDRPWINVPQLRPKSRSASEILQESSHKASVETPFELAHN
jgi:hypothetical protein